MKSMKSPVRTRSDFALGIDVGGTHIRCLKLKDGQVGVIEKIRTPRAYDELVTTLSEIVERHRSGVGVIPVGIGLPGRVDPEKPIWIPGLPFLNQSSLTVDLALKAGCRVTLINDAQAALVGETKLGAAKGARNSVLVTLGTGIGGAIMIDGKIYVGHNGVAGSFGWLLAPVRLHVNPEHGPWERWASGTSLVNIARGFGLTVPEILASSSDSPTEIVDALEDFASRIGKGLGSLASLFDPQVVIVSGGLVDAWDRLKGGVTAGFQQTASPSVRRTPISVGELGSESGAIGAAFTAQTYFSQIS
jgi:glucokinase